MRRYLSLVILPAPSLLASCKREERTLRNLRPDDTLNTVQISGLNPGANSIPTPPQFQHVSRRAPTLFPRDKNFTSHITASVVTRTAAAALGPPDGPQLDLRQRAGKYFCHHHAGQAERHAFFSQSHS